MLASTDPVAVVTLTRGPMGVEWQGRAEQILPSEQSQCDSGQQWTVTLAVLRIGRGLSVGLRGHSSHLNSFIYP